MYRFILYNSYTLEFRLKVLYLSTLNQMSSTSVDAFILKKPSFLYHTTKGAPPQQLLFLFQSSKHTCTKLTGSLKSPLSYARKISSIYWQKPTYMTILKSLTIFKFGHHTFISNLKYINKKTK